MKFSPAKVFRETEGVVFSDLWIEHQNGLDLVIHRGKAVSPPNQSFYIHYNQVDNNRVIEGARIFELIDRYGQLNWNHYMVLLTPETGALQIPRGVYHRSFSCPTGSILLNQAIRYPNYNPKTEFQPVSARSDLYLYNCLTKTEPQYVNSTRAEILKLLWEWQ
jgi:hypothetical protein